MNIYLYMYYYYDMIGYRSSSAGKIHPITQQCVFLGNDRCLPTVRNATLAKRIINHIDDQKGRLRVLHSQKITTQKLLWETLW